MQEITLIFPHQLFESNEALSKKRVVWLIEYGLFFTQYRYHAQKLVLHRASMMYYADYLRQKGYDVKYVACNDDLAQLKKMFAHAKATGITAIHYVEVVDDWLQKRLLRYARENEVAVKTYPTTGFLCTENYLREHFAGSKRFYLTDFYIAQRKRFNVLIEKGKPRGGKWSFDTDNRKKMPAGTAVPPLPSVSQNNWVSSAKEYVAEYLPKAYGYSSSFIYPVTHHDAAVWLENFLEQRFAHYGIYQDAIVKNETFLFHAVLTPMLNIGLLTPGQIIQRSIEVAEKKQVPINSLEGFVRQVLGWREYIRAVYALSHVQQRTTNYWNHTRSIPASFYTATTGIEPIDNCIQRIQQTAYAHHIERLMVLGNFMCLCGFSPDEVYRWFMELFIDAYDWVMVPNVYGMSQFADGGLMSTKPYISSSNYILKMSNYKKGEWCDVWDALYWNFIHQHRSFFASNPRMSIMTAQLDKMGARLNTHLHKAEKYLATL